MNREDFKKQMMKVVDRYIDQEVEIAEKEWAQYGEPTAPEVLGELNQTITRLEVIDSEGRSYIKRDCKIEFSIQDDGKTLKLFVGGK